MKKATVMVCAIAGVSIIGAALAAGEAKITLRPEEKGPEVPKTLYGIFFEDINYSADGGIYPELVANRGFDWDNGSTHGWENDFRGDAQARVSIEHGRPGDVIVLAGKGHEDYQEIKGKKYPMDERVLIQEVLSELAAEGKAPGCLAETD